MTKTQSASFHYLISTFINKKHSAHQSTGARLLANHEADIRKAIVECSCTHEEVTIALIHMENSPVAHLSPATVKQYLSQLCKELGITRRPQQFSTF